ELGIILVADVEMRARSIEVEGLGIRDAVDPVDDLEARDVDDSDEVRAAAGDVEFLVVGAEEHAARPTRRLDLGDQRIVLVAEHGEPVTLLVADEDAPGSLGARSNRQRQQGRGCQRGKRPSPLSSHAPSLLAPSPRPDGLVNAMNASARLGAPASAASAPGVPTRSTLPRCRMMT